MKKILYQLLMKFEERLEKMEAIIKRNKKIKYNLKNEF